MRLLISGAISASASLACPVCSSSAGQQVRASILSSDFGFHLTASLLPFAVCAAIVIVLHRGAKR